ncbi:MAG: protein translocase subunit SecF, partial [Pirellulaceae bacterium]|nr:protein translocase subunit SecF [Pirellulaceae bacterium]
DTPAPKEDTPAPKEDTPAPKEDTPAPKEDTPAPKEDAPAPKEDAPAPKEDAPAPKEDAPAPKEDTPAPKEDTPAPKEDAPAPKEDAAAPKEDTAAPKEDAAESDELPTDPAADESMLFDRGPGSQFVSLIVAEEEATATESEAGGSEDAKPEAEPAEEGQSPVSEEMVKTDSSSSETETPENDAPTTDLPVDASSDEPAETSQRVVTKVVMTFGNDINGRTVQDQLLKVAEANGLRWTEEDIDLSPMPPQTDWLIDDSRGFKQWSVAVNAGEDAVGAVLAALQTNLAETPVWPSSSKIGGKVAGDTQALAIAALLTSLVGIIIYIWIRFQRVVFGLAAVVALIHDVLIVLGAIAVSYWLAGILGFLQIQEFKISLPVVAAILTIIGYSLNDTIVVFDRIREVKGKSPNLTSDMLNVSLNQTLSRTLLTSFTTFLVVVILYFLGGAGVHDFAYCLVVGVVVGTYSSIYIASPVLLWMSQPATAAK